MAEFLLLLDLLPLHSHMDLGLSRVLNIIILFSQVCNLQSFCTACSKIEIQCHLVFPSHIATAVASSVMFSIHVFVYNNI